MSDLDDIAALIYAPPVPAPAPVPKGPITPNTGAWDDIDIEMRVVLEDLAGRIAIEIGQKDFDRAWKLWDEATITNDQRTACWTLLSSKERSAMKRNRK